MNIKHQFLLKACRNSSILNWGEVTQSAPFLPDLGLQGIVPHPRECHASTSGGYRWSMPSAKE